MRGRGWAWGALVLLGIVPGAEGRRIVDGVDAPGVVLVGRYAVVDVGGVKVARFGYPGSGVMVRFQGGPLQLLVECGSEKAALTVVVDRGVPELRLLKKGQQVVTVGEGVAREDGVHTVEVLKRTETWQGVVTLRGLIEEGATRLMGAGSTAPLGAGTVLPRRRLLFVGDSVTCGAGVDNNATCTADPARPANDAYNSYGMVLGRRLDAQTQLVCYGGRGLVRDYRGLGAADGVLNAPEFLDLAVATDDPAGRAAWDAGRWVPDGIVVSLGTNDFSLQKTKPLDGKAWVAAYVALVKRLRAEYPKAAIWLTEGAIVTDPLLGEYVRETVKQLGDAKVRYAAAKHYPGNGCDGHPTAAQHLRMAADLEPELRVGLGW